MARADGGYTVATEKDAPDAQPEPSPPSEPTPPVTGQARIVCVYYNPPGRDDGNEYVRVEAPFDMDFTGWTLTDESQRRFVLPSVQVSAGDIIDVPNTGGAAWNNGGDIAYLYNPAGTLIGSHSYVGGGEGVCE